MPGDPPAVPGMMTMHPAPMSPVRRDPSPIAIMVAGNPHFSALMMVCTGDVNGCEGRQKGKTNCEDHQFHFESCSPDWTSSAVHLTLPWRPPAQ